LLCNTPGAGNTESFQSTITLLLDQWDVTCWLIKMGVLTPCWMHLGTLEPNIGEQEEFFEEID
jgi:hypothetical protein